MKIANIVPNVEAGTVTFHYADNTSRTYALADLPATVSVQCELLGLGTRIQNAYAGKGSDGVAACRQAADEMYDALKRGEWDSRGSQVGVWAAAIARATDTDLEAAAAAWQKADEKKRAEIRKHPVILRAKLAIEQERLAEKAESAPDVSELF